MKDKINFTNVEKRDNKFICQITYGELADANMNGLLCYNFELNTFRTKTYEDKLLKNLMLTLIRLIV